MQTKSTVAVPVTDGVARWLPGDSGAHLTLLITLDRNPEDLAFHPKVFTCKVKDGKTRMTISRAVVDLATYANIEENTANDSPRGVELERSYATTLDLVADDKKKRSFFVGAATIAPTSSVVAADFVISAMDITTPPSASPSAKLATPRKGEGHLSLDDHVGSDGDDADSLGPDEDVADDSRSESASAGGDESAVATPPPGVPESNIESTSKGVSFVDDFGEEDDVEGAATTAPTDRLSSSASASSSGSEDDDEPGTGANAHADSKGAIDSDPSASRLRLARAAMALGVPPPSPSPSEAMDSVDVVRKRSALGLYASPSKKNAVAAGAADAKGGSGPSSRFRSAVQKIRAAGRFTGAFAANGADDGGEDGAGASSLLDELNAEPDVASLAKAESFADDTELQRRHRSAVEQAVASLKANATFAETLGSFETTRRLTSTLEAALFERTSELELDWETKAEASRAEIERLRLAAKEGGVSRTAADASIASSSEEPDPVAGVASPPRSPRRELFEDATTATASSNVAKDETTKTSSPAEAAGRGEKDSSGAPPGSPSALFQRAARVGALEARIERLALESRKHAREALSEKKVAAEARARALDAEASAEARSAENIRLATSALRAELRTLQDDHDALASALATRTKERDAARIDASLESKRASRCAADEKEAALRERDGLRAELEISKRQTTEAAGKLAERAAELDALSAELASARESLARADGEAAARANDLETTETSLVTATATLVDARTELAETKEKLETAERSARDASSAASATIESLRLELGVMRDAESERASLEARLEREPAEWRRRAAEAEAARDAAAAARDRDVRAAKREAEARLEAARTASTSVLEATRREVSVAVEAGEAASAEAAAARRETEAERARREAADHALVEATERARRGAETAARSVSEAEARAKDAERHAKDAERRASDAERRAKDTERAFEEAEARAGAEAETLRAAAAAATAMYEDALAAFEAEMATKDGIVERTRALLAESRGRSARLSEGGNSARGDDSTRSGRAYVGLEASEGEDVFGDSDVRESSVPFSDGGKSPRRESRKWNDGAKDERETIVSLTERTPKETAAAAAASAAGEIRRLRDASDAGRAETERLKRELSDAREHARTAARLAAADSERRASAETERVRDALTRADAELLRTRAELRAATDALAESDKALRSERLGVSRMVEEAKASMRRESASSARVAASRALEAEMDRERLVAEARRAAELARAESLRLRDALSESRRSLDASEAERFELRRALEAHVGALVEAKVDEAARAGELEAMREDFDDMRRRYEAAAARTLALETRPRWSGDSARFDSLVVMGAEGLSRPKISAMRAEAVFAEKIDVD